MRQKDQRDLVSVEGFIESMGDGGGEGERDLITPAEL